MLRLDNENIKIEANSKDPIVKELYDLWVELKNKYELDKGGSINFIFSKEMYTDFVDITDGTQALIHRRRLVPRHMKASLRVNFTDKKNDPHTIIYYDTVRKNKKDEEVFHPNNVDLSDNHILKAKDKELIIFLYAFSRYVKSDFQFKNIVLENQKTNNITIEDLKSEAIISFEKAGEQATAFYLISKMSDTVLREYAHIINIPNFKTGQIELVRASVLAHVNKNDMVSHLKNYVDTLSVNIDLVMLEFKNKITDLIENKKIECSVYKPEKRATWSTLDQHGNKETEICVLDNTKVDVDQFIAFLNSDSAAKKIVENIE